jgi:RNA polymerase sigma-70 factor (ECF subfamily)
VARRFEERQGRRKCRQQSGVDLDDVAGDEEQLSRLFDRAWARSMMRQAAECQAERAAKMGKAAERRVELLRLRFHEGLAIRTIAERWETDAAKLHHDYATARNEFKAALRDVVSFHHPGSKYEIDRECSALLEMLG